jgi:hypothetical protein
MASLKAIQKRVPSATTMVGRVIAFVDGKHYDMGQYVGDGSVILSKEGEKLMAPAKKADIKETGNTEPDLQPEA